jgi:hypothetical protein
VENLEKVYRELDRQAWSITKLLGDVSNLMPEQIELLSMTLTHGEPITVMGVAKRDADMSGTDIVFDFNRRLRESKLFLDYGPVPSIEQPDARGYTEFKLTAVLDDPLRPVQPRPENDYAVLSYRDRRYGPVDDDGYLIVDPDARQERLDAMIARGIDLSKPLPAMEAAPSSSSEAPSSSQADARSSTPPSERTSSSSSRASSEETETDVADARTSREPSRESTRSRDRASSSGRDRESSREGGSSDGPASRSSIRSRVIEIPEPLSSEEIETLSNAEAKARLAKIAGARNAPNATEEQKKALKDEWDSLLNRIRETNP